MLTQNVQVSLAIHVDYIKPVTYNINQGRIFGSSSFITRKEVYKKTIEKIEVRSSCPVGNEFNPRLTKNTASGDLKAFTVLTSSQD